MLDWMILPFKRYAEFSGRSRRMEYWSFALLTFVVYVVCLAIMMAGGLSLAALSNPEMAAAQQPGALFYVGGGLVGIFALAAFIPNLALNVRRLHDRNMSGWFLLLLIVLSAVPFIGATSSSVSAIFRCPTCR